MFEYTLGDPDYYTPLERTLARDPEATRYAAVGLPESLERVDLGVWVRWMPPDHKLPEQGWKVHVSAEFADAHEVLDIVAEVCGAMSVGFKHLASERIFLWIHHKHGPRPQSGKFCALYPTDVEQARVLMDGSRSCVPVLQQTSGSRPEASARQARLATRMPHQQRPFREAAAAVVHAASSDLLPCVNPTATPKTTTPAEDTRVHAMGKHCSPRYQTEIGRDEMETPNDRAATDDVVTVAQFVQWCAAALNDGLEALHPLAQTPAVRGALEAFIAGGAAAVRAATADEVWLQFGLVIPRRPETSRTALYQAAGGTLRTLTTGELVHDAFFVHKPPGIRLRLRTELACRQTVEAELNRTLHEWTELGLITGWRPAVYEPERALFGGPVSMRSVHRVFTADSIAWLGFHGATEPPGPAWAMSLLMIRELFAALAIVGWEDRDVWDRLRRQAGRAVTVSVRENGVMERLADVLNRHWHMPDATRELLSPAARDLLDEYATAVHAEAPRWLSEYFTAPGATLGPRETAAHVIIFHWNRAKLPAHRQALFTEALARPAIVAMTKPGAETWTTR